MKHHIYLFISLIMFSFGCDSNGTDNLPEIKEVEVVGTDVKPDFQQSHRFAIRAIPFDENNDAVLSRELIPTVSLQNLTITTSTIDETIEPSGKPFALALDIDASGSMATNDSNDSRIKGAKAFVSVVATNAPSAETSVFEYSRSDARLLQGFTNNVDSLQRAIDMIGANGGTPTYTSLLQIIDVLESAKPVDNFERAIVLLSDGKPNSTSLRDSTCATARNANIPIYSIGLGPASDVVSPSGSGIEEMREIASCSGGTYAGIDSNDVEGSAISIFNNIALATTLGSVVINVQLMDVDPALFPKDALIEGELMISNGEFNSPPAGFSFRVPGSEN